MTTTDTRREAREMFNMLEPLMRRRFPDFSPERFALEHWDTKEIFILAAVELQQLNAHMMSKLRGEASWVERGRSA